MRETRSLSSTPNWIKILSGYVIGMVADWLFRGIGLSELLSLVLGGAVVVAFYFILVLALRGLEEDQ